MEQIKGLDKDLIKDTHLWRLALRIDENKMHVVLFCSIEDNSLIYREIPLDSAAQSHQKAIEEAIYDNPLLLSDFQRVDCVIETDKFTVIPSEIDDADVKEKIFNTTFPSFDGVMIENKLSELNATLLMGLNAELTNFIRRTFNNPNILHHLTPLCIYFNRKNKMGNAGKMYAHIHNNQLDLLSFGKDTLRLANSYAFRDPMDAVYYILACAEASSNLGRYDSIRYGYRTESYNGIHDMMCKTRSEGFGKEVQKRILLGTYVLSSGYYDAYYKKAQNMRGTIVKAFKDVFEKYDCILAPTVPMTAFEKGFTSQDSVQTYLTDICTVPVNIAGLPGVSIPCGSSADGMPIGMQIIGDSFCEAKILNVAYKFEQATSLYKQAEMGVVD